MRGTTIGATWNRYRSCAQYAVSPKSSKIVLKALEEQRDTGGLLSGLPDDTKFAHKTGSLGNVQHDGGIVEGKNPFIIVVLYSGDGFSLQKTLDSMKSISKAMYDDIAIQK